MENGSILGNLLSSLTEQHCYHHVLPKKTRTLGEIFKGSVSLLCPMRRRNMHAYFSERLCEARNIKIEVLFSQQMTKTSTAAGNPVAENMQTKLTGQPGFPLRRDLAMIWSSKPQLRSAPSIRQSQDHWRLALLNPSLPRSRWKAFSLELVPMQSLSV
ncbi:hypothetical protein E2P81_ATG05813 [Venturia nashicola]|nr:hypothetical protein E2P81_ATG05813 [Venturia nashicola]